MEGSGRMMICWSLREAVQRMGMRISILRWPSAGEVASRTETTAVAVMRREEDLVLLGGERSMRDSRRC